MGVLTNGMFVMTLADGIDHSKSFTKFPNLSKFGGKPQNARITSDSATRYQKPLTMDATSSSECTLIETLLFCSDAGDFAKKPRKKREKSLSSIRKVSMRDFNACKMLSRCQSFNMHERMT